MQPDQHQRIMGYFIEEAKDHLNTLEQGLLNLQSTIEDSEAINEVFRAAHSVKGGAAMLGLNSIQHVSHRLEDFFKVLKDTPIKVDQKLENLLLRAFDTLKELLEQLQGPFGLTEDTANGLLANVEPTFAELEQHLNQLVGATPQLATAGIAGSTSDAASLQERQNEELAQLFRSEVPSRLREMLSLFKQADTNITTRHQLQELCRSLSSLGEQYGLSHWCTLIETARKAIAHTENRYATLAPIVIKDIKQAQELVLLGRITEIAPADQLVALVPVAIEVDGIEEDDFLDLLATADMDESLEMASSSADLSFEELASAGNLDLSNTTSDLFEEDLDLQNGPEMGMAELNSLADLFEGEMPELGLTWQQEEVIEDSSELLANNLGFGQADEASDFSDLLFDEPTAQSNRSTTSDDDSLFDDSLFDDLESSSSSEAAIEVQPSNDSGFDDFDDLLQISSTPSDSNRSDFEVNFGGELEQDLLSLESTSDSMDLNLDELSDFAPPDVDLDFESDRSVDLEGALDGLGELFDGLSEGDLASSQAQASVSESAIASSTEEVSASFDSVEAADFLLEEENLEDSLFNNAAEDFDLNFADFPASDDASITNNDLADMDALFGDDLPAPDSTEPLVLSVDSPVDEFDTAFDTTALDEDLFASSNIEADIDLDSLGSGNLDASIEPSPFPISEVPDPWDTEDTAALFLESPASSSEPPNPSEIGGVSLEDLDLSDLGLEEEPTPFSSTEDPSQSVFPPPNDDIFDAPLDDFFGEGAGDTPDVNEPAGEDFDLKFGTSALDDSEEGMSSSLDEIMTGDLPDVNDFSSSEIQELEDSWLTEDLAFEEPNLTDEASNETETIGFELIDSTDDVSNVLLESDQDLEDLLGETTPGLDPELSEELNFTDLDLDAADEAELSEELNFTDLGLDAADETTLNSDLLNLGSDDSLDSLLDDNFSSVPGETEAIADFNFETPPDLEDNLIDTDDLFSSTSISEDLGEFTTDEPLLEFDDSHSVLDALTEDASLDWSSDFDQVSESSNTEFSQSAAALDLDDLLESTATSDQTETPDDLTGLLQAETSPESTSLGDLSELNDFLSESAVSEESSDLDNFFNEPEGTEASNDLDDFLNAADVVEEVGDLDNFFNEPEGTEASNDLDDFLSEPVAIDESGSGLDEFLNATANLEETSDLDDLLSETAFSDVSNDLLTNESFSIGSDLDDFLAEDLATNTADFDSLLTTDEAATVEPIPDTTDDFGDLDDLLLEQDSNVSDAIATDDFGNLDNLDHLLDEESSLSGDEFADLNNFLDGDTSLEAETAIESSSLSMDALGDFSDLEALLNTDDESAVPASTISTPAAATGAFSEPSVETDSSFDDLDDLLKEAEQKMGGTPSVKSSRGTIPQTRRPVRPGRVFSDQTMRVSVKHLDSLSNLVGELVVNRNSLEQDQERLRQSLDNLLYQVQQLSDVGQRMQDLYERSLLESSLLASRHGHRMSAFSAIGSRDTAIAATETDGSSEVEYDPLEMDRFTGFHSLSQEMIELIVRVRESSSDIEFIVDETEQVTRMFRQVTTQLQEGLTRSRMVPFAQTADRLPRAVRDISMKIGKQAELVIEGRDTLIDKMILEQLYDPMTHLVNNAITHGIETPEQRLAAGKPASGRITIRAFHQGNQTIISVSDDGAGIDVERVKTKAVEKGLFTRSEIQSLSRLDVFDILFHPGFSTKDQADDFSGRGVGMDVVRTSLSEIRGVINTDSTLGKGTAFTIRLPLTLSISKALCCISDRARIAFPMDGVEDMLDIPKERIQKGPEGQDCIAWRDTILPVHPLSELLGYNRHLSRGNVYGGNQEDDIVSVVVLRSAGNFLALQVDQVLGEQEIVIKQLEGPVPKPVGVAGATVLGDGRIMPIADVLELIDLSMGRIRRDAGGSLWDQGNLTPAAEAAAVKTEPMVLIVDDSITVRELLSMTFNKVGYRVEQARDGQEAWEKLRSGLPCDIVFCDIEMPRMDGLELLSRIQKDPNLKHLPIAMLTSRGADRHRQMASTLGASGYFTKPYLEEALLDAAQRMLKGERLLSN